MPKIRPVKKRDAKSPRSSAALQQDSDEKEKKAQTAVKAPATFFAGVFFVFPYLSS